MLKTLLSGTMLAAKLLTLVCFSNMGLMALAPKAWAKMPCHEVMAPDESSFRGKVKNCETCVLALAVWSEAFVSAKINNTEPLEVITTVSEPAAWQPGLALRLENVFYRPPPLVVIKSAKPLSVPSTVLIV